MAFLTKPARAGRLTQRLECHPHTVEVTGSNPVPPNDLRQIAGSASAFGLPDLPLSECYGYAVDVTSSCARCSSPA